jgi:hypothetical protein
MGLVPSQPVASAVNRQPSAVPEEGEGADGGRGELLLIFVLHQPVVRGVMLAGSSAATSAAGMCGGRAGSGPTL